METIYFLQVNNSNESSIYDIGVICSELTIEQIKELWSDWWEGCRDKGEYPESDSQFIDWLIANNHGKPVPYNVQCVTFES